MGARPPWTSCEPADVEGHVEPDEEQGRDGHGRPQEGVGQQVAREVRGDQREHDADPGRDQGGARERTVPHFTVQCLPDVFCCATVLQYSTVLTVIWIVQYCTVLYS